MYIPYYYVFYGMLIEKQEKNGKNC